MAKRSSKRNAKANAARRMGDRDGSASSAKPYVPLADLKRGRDHGDAMLYDPNQEYNYKSGEIRYGNAIGLAPQVMRSPDGLFRVPSSGRSEKGYWSPALVRLWCKCSTAAGRWGTILEVPGFDPFQWVVKSPSLEVLGIWRWQGEPDCTTLGGSGELIEIANAQPDFDLPDPSVFTFSLGSSVPGFYSISLGYVGSGGDFRFTCFKVNNVQPGGIAIEIEPLPT